ncbi:MAG: hydrogenase assembly protein HupF [Candidatus Aeolococcus gillhamiae]|uniref:Hydrogenase assembly protein HupF n=1 Tax=Candidatus Aeolococcus gillhamiae TaxID=3127015 RepID=A0A2W5YYP3_9BACT|nr:MAG: hydrogenase assembly protein HupF [Candidatus Dormibacter sp. RRmetagenome_bin12]
MSENVCHDEVCITCSDQLLEMVVTAVSPDASVAQATCDGVACEVAVDLLDGVMPGDHLLAHGGVALQRGTLEVAR